MQNLTHEQSSEINQLASALAKAQGKLKVAVKDSENPYFKSMYSDLNSVWAACREPLSENNLCIIQFPSTNTDGSLELKTTLAHSSGQWVASKISIKLTKNDPQAIGSAITYLRRYCLSAIVGICSEEDDDGEKAMQRTKNMNFPVDKKPSAKNYPKKINNSVKTEGYDHTFAKQFSADLIQLRSYKDYESLATAYEALKQFYTKEKYPEHRRTINKIVSERKRELAEIFAQTPPPINEHNQEVCEEAREFFGDETANSYQQEDLNNG